MQYFKITEELKGISDLNIEYASSKDTRFLLKDYAFSLLRKILICRASEYVFNIRSGT